MLNAAPYVEMKEFTRSGKKITLTDRVLDSMVRGVYVITARDGDDVNGMTAAMACRVSSFPYYVMVSVWHENYSCGLIRRARSFAVNILAEDQVDIAKHFGRQTKKEVDKFKRQDIYWEARATGAPILLDSLAYMDCRLVEIYEPPKGDHTMFVGEVVEADILRDAKPLVYRREDYPYRVLVKHE